GFAQPLHPVGWVFAVVMLLNVLVFTPFLEESIYRGLLFAWLREKVTLPLAILISATIFSLSHLSVIDFPTHFLFGVYTAILTWRSRSLWPAIALHFAANVTSLLLTTRVLHF